MINQLIVITRALCYTPPLFCSNIVKRNEETPRVGGEHEGEDCNKSDRQLFLFETRGRYIWKQKGAEYAHNKDKSLKLNTTHAATKVSAIGAW